MGNAVTEAALDRTFGRLNDPDCKLTNRGNDADTGCGNWVAGVRMPAGVSRRLPISDHDEERNRNSSVRAGKRRIVWSARPSITQNARFDDAATSKEVDS
jgi:hypothetical protein